MPSQHLKSIRKKFSNQLGIIPIPLIIGAILVITAAAASIPVTYIINQSSQDTRSRAGICCEAGSCNDGWSYGRDENAPQATCEQRKQEACASRGGPASGGGSCSGGGGGSTPTPGTFVCGSGSASGCAGQPDGHIFSTGGLCMQCFKNSATLCGRREVSASLCGGGGGTPTATPTGGGGGGGGTSCVYSDYCAGCIQANRCLQYSDGTIKYCNQWIKDECTECEIGGFCPQGKTCKSGIKCSNGFCAISCNTPTPTPTVTPPASCSGGIAPGNCNASGRICVVGVINGTPYASFQPPPQGKVCQGVNQPPVDTPTVTPPASCSGGIAPGNCNASGRICVVGVINGTPYASFQPPPQGKVCQGVNQPPVDTPTCVPPNNSINPSTQQCCSGSPQLVPGWGTGYFCIETSPPPPNSPTATISPSPSPTATWTPTPSASITISPTATWTPIPTQTPPPPTVTPPASCSGGIAPGNCNASGRICVVGVINGTPYASFQPPPQGKVCQGVNQPPVSVTVTATAAPSPPVTVSPTLSPTATAAPTTAGCITDGGYWYPGLTCCSGQSHDSFSGDTICGPSPTATPAPAPAVISAIQQVAQAITTTVTQVATTIWDWITGGSQTTPTPTSTPTATPSPSPSLTPSATAAPPPPTNTPIPTATPTVTPPASCSGGIAPGNCNASGRICVVGVINGTPYASFQPPPQGKVCQGVNQPPVSVTVTATAAPSPPVTVSPTLQFTLTITQNDLMSYCVEQYGNQYTLLLTVNGPYCSYYDGQRTHQHQINPNSICQNLTGNPSAVAVPFDNQYQCVVN